MIPLQLRGSMMEAKAQHLRFDILEEKKLELEKNREEEEGKKKRKKIRLQSVSKKHDWSAMTFAG